MTDVKDISIKTFLAERGINPTTERAGYGMYNSPLREEHTPSFKVDYIQNLWYDFGLAEGGSIIDLVAKLENCTIAEAFNKLKGCDVLTIPQSKPKSINRPPSPLQIREVRPLQNSRLLGYIANRGVDLEVAKYYCREVHYTLAGKSYFAVGFSNDAGGWELNIKGFKLTISPKLPTTFDKGADDCFLFEGFFDMISYITFMQSVKPTSNMVVLNSVANLRKAEVFLKTNHTIYCFLDNDDAGRKALAEIKTYGVNVVDCSHLYKDFKDVNECLEHYVQTQKQEVTQPQKRVKMKF